MSREHIEFVQAQVLPWEMGWAIRPAVECKVLSRDHKSGAASAVLRYPAGWRAAGGFSLTVAEELFVLAGELRMGDLCYQAGDYAYLTAGYAYTGLAAGAEGAVVLTFFSAEPEFGPLADADPGHAIERLATHDMEWDGNVDPNVVGAGIGKKTLRVDPVAGDSTWILRIGPMDPLPDTVETPLEKHPYVEEMYQLDGEISTNVGVMRRGAYFWRPPRVSHGPIASRPGFMALFRSHGGARSTEWSAKKYPVVWNAPYQPVLPGRLRERVLRAFDSSQLY